MQSICNCSTNRGYGIDLAGYTVGKTRVAEAFEDDTGQTVIQILSGHVFDRKFGTDVRLSPVADGEREALIAWLNAGRVAVDVPIDLQQLAQIGSKVDHVWELTKRPIDRAYGGMAPLADRIGAPVARFQHLLSGLPGESISASLGIRLFETYPAASLKLIKKVCPSLDLKSGYKPSRARWTGAEWVRADDNKQSASLADMCGAIGLYAVENIEIDDDQFDAALCALAALYASNTHYSCLGEELMRSAPKLTPGLAPDGYVLLKHLPATLLIQHKVRKSDPQTPAEQPPATAREEV
ncbi:DUF429 domain-containing protein [Magnetospirillum sp. ME-1]|uniref:DUF429 domain-containing protein n=1 Tax=Magnetospirillum sp. ME-1 TaxID=1639348 RepID=UPI00143D24C4|nr:DUF429 domain-containing protein [Magnetospirillum sp. ME-1]